MNVNSISNQMLNGTHQTTNIYKLNKVNNNAMNTKTWNWEDTNTQNALNNYNAQNGIGRKINIFA